MTTRDYQNAAAHMRETRVLLMHLRFKAEYLRSLRTDGYEEWCEKVGIEPSTTRVERAGKHAERYATGQLFVAHIAGMI